MQENTPTKKRKGGIPVNRVALSILAVIAVLHLIIIMLIIDVNRSSSQLSDLMQRSGNYRIEATKIMESTMVLSETCSNYIQMPLTGDGSANVGALIAYAEQLREEDNAPQMLERFRTYHVSDEVLASVEEAAEYAERMFDIQNHAIALMRSVYPTPELPELSVIPEVSLTEEELAMPREARVAAAKRLVLERDYASLRYYATESINQCNQILQNEFDRAAADAKKRVSIVRTLLWIAVFIIILVLSVTFVLFYELIVKPVLRYADEIDQNKSIEKTRAISELCRMVDAYNNLWNRRGKLESILREAAKTDSLTGLSNRYCMEQDLIELEESAKSMGVLLFDVDFLKETNDMQGHLAGDRLLCATADCIKKYFSIKNACFCYRIGGDEFVAILPDCSENDIRSRIERFKSAVKSENITVSVGYSYGESVDADGFKELMRQADQQMYIEKQVTHSERE